MPANLNPTSERLREIAASIPDQAFARRLCRIFEEATRTIAGMGQLELAKYEDMSETGYPDLSMWEQVAPVIRDTVVDVNRLLSTVRELFPAPTSGDLSDLIGEALSEAGADSTEEMLLERHKEEATHHIQVLANVLAAEVSNLGERMRSPAVVSDRWNLLADLQEIRGKFRGAVGDMVFLSAAAFGSVTREEVIPGYSEDVAEAISARRSVTDLARVMAVHHTRLKAASPEFPQRLSVMIRDLDAFGRSRAYVVLRTADKRRFVEFHSLLRELGSTGRASPVATAVGEFAFYVQSLSHINRRACLMEHDRQVLATCCVKLEHAEFVRLEQPDLSSRLFDEAASLAQDLYGRHPLLDGFLRKSKKSGAIPLEPHELEAAIDQLRGLLAAATTFQ